MLKGPPMNLKHFVMETFACTILKGATRIFLLFIFLGIFYFAMEVSFPPTVTRVFLLPKVAVKKKEKEV